MTAPPSSSFSLPSKPFELKGGGAEYTVSLNPWELLWTGTLVVAARGCISWCQMSLILVGRLHKMSLGWVRSAWDRRIFGFCLCASPESLWITPDRSWNPLENSPRRRGWSQTGSKESLVSEWKWQVQLPLCALLDSSVMWVSILHT